MLKYFTNPYNFIPLDKKCKRSSFEKSDVNYTGYFDCSIELLTPLIIPNTSWDQALCTANEREGLAEKGGQPGKSKIRFTGYEFFSYEDLTQQRTNKPKEYTRPPLQPVIPGSEIRGTLRSLYEAAFNGCMSTSNVSMSFGRRNSTPKSPGILRREKGSSRCLPSDGIGKKNNSKTLADILKGNGGYQPCTSINMLCSACKVFGMTSKSEGEKDALASRIRCTDAELISTLTGSHYADNYDIYVLPETAGPQPSTVEFYTKPPFTDENDKAYGEGYWTYDYMRVKKKDHWNNKDNGKAVESKRLPENMPQIRGRKFYWHSKKLLKSVKKEDPVVGRNAMQQRVRALRESETDKKRWFRFRVYFKQLSKEELARLRWVLDFGETDARSPEYAHKMGHGKPLGFGSVRIKIESLYFMKMDRKTGRLSMEKSKTLKDIGNSMTQPNHEILEAIKCMCNWNQCPEDVSYPLARKSLKGNPDLVSYAWFSKNKKKKNNETYFEKVLPLPQEEVRKSKEKEIQSKRLSYEV